MDEKEKKELLKKFMLEFFDFNSLKKAGFYDNKIKRNDYQAQADRVCQFFGFKTVYEYGAREIHAHLTYTKGERPKDEPFLTFIPNIYD